MVLNLDLLPKDYQSQIKSMAQLAWVKSVLRCLVTGLTIYNAFLGLLYFVISEQAGILQKRASEISQGYSFYNQEVETISQKTDKVNRAGSDYGTLTPRFWLLLEELPDNIKLKNLSLSLENNRKILLAGVATNRQALLDFEQTLLKIPWVEETALPKSQLLPKEDINFTIDVTVNPPAINEYLNNLKINEQI